MTTSYDDFLYPMLYPIECKYKKKAAKLLTLSGFYEDLILVW